MIKELSQLDSPFARRLNGAVQERIEQRRLPILSTLMAYLENPNFLHGTKNLHLKYAGKNDITKAIRDLIIDLKFDQEPESDHDAATEQDPDDMPPPPKRKRPNQSFAQKLADRLAKRNAEINAEDEDDSGISLNSIRKAMKKYEVSGKRPKLLEKVYQALCSIPPTSTGKMSLVSLYNLSSK